MKDPMTVAGCCRGKVFISFLFLQLCCPIGITPMGNRVYFHGESQLQQRCTTQSTVHAGCFSLHNPPNSDKTTGALTCAQILMHAIAHGGVQTHVRECALKVDSGRKTPCCTGELNLRQWCASLMLYQLSYIPILSWELMCNLDSATL